MGVKRNNKIQKFHRKRNKKKNSKNKNKLIFQLEQFK